MKLPIPPVTNGADVTGGKSLKPAPAVTCDVVTGGNSESAAQNEIEPDSASSAPMPDDDDIERDGIMSEEFFNG